MLLSLSTKTKRNLVFVKSDYNTKKHEGKNMKRLSKTLMLSALLGVASLHQVDAALPLALQVPQYPSGFPSGEYAMGINDILVITGHANIKEIQKQLDRGINTGSDSYTALEIPELPGQGTVFIATRQDGVLVNNQTEQLVSNQESVYGLAIVTLAIRQSDSQIIVVELAYIGNYIDFVNDQFQTPDSPVQINAKQFKLNVDQNLRKKSKDFEIEVRAKNDFHFCLKLETPNTVPEVTQSQFLDVRNDPNSITVVLQNDARSINIPVDGLKKMTKKLKMPYGGYIKVNGILSIRLDREQVVNTFAYPAIP